MKKFIGIIPARYNSSRFPGKPLMDIRGKSMIERVYQGVSKILDKVYVATDDQRIADEVTRFGGEFVMTDTNHSNGTTRCAEAAEILQCDQNDIIINIQGDEPLIASDHIRHLKDCFTHTDTSFATLIAKVTDVKTLDNEGEVFVTVDCHDNAMYFSRSVIPYGYGYYKENWLKNHDYYKHVGIYAYTYEALKKFVSLPNSSLENVESLEQNRWIQNGYKINVALTDAINMPIDTPEDLENVIAYMEENNIL